ncbi:MAG: serine protease [Chitinophagaceae bacterium]|nr:serine protease [Chitinophagaceae bacterium]
MKKIILIVFLVFTAFYLRSQTFPITADILRQTYIIQTDTLQGTCFLVEMNTQEYILTAKHLFSSKLHNGDSTRIIIYQENRPRSLAVQYYVHADSAIDIAVLKLKESIKVITPFDIEEEVTLGQDIYFLGFPSFNNIQFATSGTIGVLPLVKKGIISGWTTSGSNTLFFLDGHNNPGFSGGPVVCISGRTKRPIIFGVISGYYYENKPVKNNNGQDELTHIQENSGIIKCYSTRIVKQIILSNK